MVMAPKRSVSKEGKYTGWSQTSSLVFSAIILWNPIPTPSMTARRQAHPIAEFLAAFAPPLIARAPPVKNPAMTVPMLEFVHCHLTCRV